MITSMSDAKLVKALLLEGTDSQMDWKKGKERG